MDCNSEDLGFIANFATNSLYKIKTETKKQTK